MADRIATCLGCGISWRHLADRAKVPEWCGDCHRRRAADRVRAKYEKRPCRVAKCVDCGRFIAIVNRPGHLPKRCAGCKLERERDRGRAGRQANPQYFRDVAAAWRSRNPELARQRSREASHHRRAVETCKVTTAEVERMLARPCAYCGAPSEHIDHIIPLSRGGRHSIGNLTGACAKCNKSKSNKLLVEWRPQRKENNMLYRATTHASVYVEALDREVELNPFTVLDDRDKDAAKVLRTRPDLFERVESETATAAPGERRNTARRRG